MTDQKPPSPMNAAIAKAILFLLVGASVLCALAFGACLLR